MAVLVIAEHNNRTLAENTRNVVTAAAGLESDIHLLIAGNDCNDVAEAGAGLRGVATVLLADDPAFDHGIAEALAPLIASLAANYSHVLAAASTWGKNLIPRAGALLDLQPISDITGFVDSATFTRPIYAGNAIATVRSLDPIKLLTIRPTAFAPAPDGGQAETSAVRAHSPTTNGVTFVDEQLSASDRPELTSAKIVISGGRGLGSRAAFGRLENLATRLNAAIGASRAAVDAGYIANDCQVGQTGKVVAPDLYIAVGISGAIQHLAGMKDSKIIVAINNDRDAPIFQIADYGLVQDWSEALDELDNALQ